MLFIHKKTQYLKIAAVATFNAKTIS